MSALAQEAGLCVCGSDHLCGCGCGESLNENLRRVHELTSAGASTAQVAALLEVSTAYVKSIKNGRYAPRFIKGHAVNAAPKTLVPCANCGRLFRKMGANHIYCTASLYRTHRMGGQVKANPECGQLAYLQKQAQWTAYAAGVAEREEARRAAVSYRRRFTRLLRQETDPEWLIAQRQIVADGELAQLIATQQRDERWGHRVWQRSADGYGFALVSLDRHVDGTGEKLGGHSINDGHDYRMTEESRALDPAAIFEADEDTARLLAAAGTLEPDDILHVDGDTLDWLQEKLRAEGFKPTGITKAERVRLRTPESHAGRNVKAAPTIPGRKKRREKVAHKAANRNRGNSNRPAQKPRKRWERESA
jgi:hypothetical protein